MNFKAAEAVEVNGVDHETSSETESEHAPEAEPETEQPAVDQDREMDVKKEDLLKVSLTMFMSFLYVNFVP